MNPVNREVDHAVDRAIDHAVDRIVAQLDQSRSQSVSQSVQTRLAGAGALVWGGRLVWRKGGRPYSGLRLGIWMRSCLALAQVARVSLEGLRRNSLKSLENPLDRCAD